ncbi:SGNH/GDSL hydrolase family protein [Bacillus shackletonii]|nr:SGNH/GDSL hydrolase family protein [Heyndrickxia shackletonii]NEY98819.1 SGNH/GDSL hydrolase family protein [Heyndrickxia shackletonii]
MMRYLAIGDGLCSGIGASFLSPGFIHRHARMAEEVLKERVSVTSIARSTYRSNDIYTLLEEKRVKDAMKDSGIIVLSAGHQDYIDAMNKYKENKNETEFFRSLKTCKSNIDDIVQKIKDMKSEQNDKYMLIILGLHNPYPEDENAEKWIKNFNRYMESMARKPPIYALNIHQYFKGEEEKWCTRDLLYPNNDGHRELARKMHEIGYAAIHEEVPVNK